MPAKKAAKTPATQTPQAQPRGDSLFNLLTGMGVLGRDKRESTGILRRGPSRVRDLDVAFAEDDLSHNLVSIPADDMVREWIDLQGPDETCSRLEKELDRLEARSVFHDALMWADLYGGAIVVVGLDGQKTRTEQRGNVAVEVPDLSLPRQSGKVLWLQVFDRYEIQRVELDDDGDPLLYHVIVGALEKGAQRTEAIHATRCLRFNGTTVPRRQREPAGWGASVLDRARDSIRDFNSAQAGIAVAMTEFSVGVAMLDDLTGQLAHDGGGNVAARLRALSVMRSSLGLMALDKTDDYKTVAHSFGAVSDVLDRLAERVASAGNITFSRLFGRSPAGLNATGDADIRNWYARVASQQEVKLRSPLWTLIEWIAKGLGLGLEGGGVDGDDEGESVQLLFRPLWAPTEKERAETHNVQANADALMIDRGVLDPDQVARSRFGKTGYSVETVVDDDDYDLEGVDDDDVDAADPAKGGAVDVQKEAYNGAQGATMKEIVADVVAKKIPRDSGVAMLALLFQLTDAEADKLMGSAGRGFDAPAPAPAPFGGRPAPTPPAPAPGDNPDDDDPAA